jgi:hypothetical protein
MEDKVEIDSKSDPVAIHFAQTFFILGDDEENYEASFTTNQHGLIEEGSISVSIKVDEDEAELLDIPTQVNDFLYSLKFNQEGELMEEKYGPMTNELERYLKYLIKNENLQPGIHRPAIAEGADLRRETLSQVREIAENAGRKQTCNDARDASHNVAWNANWDTACAAQAIVVMDIISEEQFNILTEPVAMALEEIRINY